MNIDELIKEAIFEKNGSKKEAYRAIKAELLLNSSAKNPKPSGKSILFKRHLGDGLVIDTPISELELSIIRKLIKEREEQVSMYEANSRKDLATSNMKNAVLFLDGEYWGFYIIEEKIDDEFMENNYHVPRENVAMIKEGEKEEGPQEETDNFNSFCEVYSKKDLSDEKNYQDITDYIDIDSMIEHYATGIYLGTTDWPGQNAGLWRNYGSKIEGNKFGDGKWRFMTFDMDFTMGAGWGGVGPDNDNFQKVMSKNKDSPTNLFVALFKNDDFKKKFAKVYCDYANEVMNIDRIKEMVSRYKEENTDLVAYSQLRWWGADTKMEGYSHWKSNYINALDNIQRFF